LYYRCFAAELVTDGYAPFGETVLAVSEPDFSRQIRARSELSSQRAQAVRSAGRRLPSADHQGSVSGILDSFPMPDGAENLIRRLIGGDEDAPAELDVEARTSTSPTLLVAAALLARTARPAGPCGSSRRHET
jgi:hypothetical protein